MNIVGLDCSTKTGVCVLSEKPDFFFSTELENKKLRGLDRVVWFGEAVGKLLNTYKPEVAIIEEYGFANAHTLVPLVEIGTIIRLACRERGISLVCIPPTSLKMFVLGKGVGPKELMMMEIYKRWKFEATTNNVADAFALAKVGQAIYGYEKITKDTATKLNKIASVTDYMAKASLSF
jgi:Holliday junction resolvasome RuvABC endonuclease subunit